jgi:hypothetical protein
VLLYTYPPPPYPRLHLHQQSIHIYIYPIVMSSFSILYINNIFKTFIQSFFGKYITTKSTKRCCCWRVVRGAHIFLRVAVPFFFCQHKKSVLYSLYSLSIEIKRLRKIFINLFLPSALFPLARLGSFGV